MQPGTGSAAAGVSNDVLVTTIAQDILAALPSPLCRADASIAKDPFALLPTGPAPTHPGLSGSLQLTASTGIMQVMMSCLSLSLCKVMRQS